MIKYLHISFLLLLSTGLLAQNKYVKTTPSKTFDSSQIVRNANTYMNGRIADLKKYAAKSKQRSARLLTRLSKKEEKYLHKLKQKDSIAYTALKSQMSFDSIKTISKDSKAIESINKAKHRMGSTFDTLKGISRFIETSKINDGANNNSVKKELEELESKLNANQYIDELIQTRTNSLMKSANSSLFKNLKGITKQSYYYNQKKVEFKKLAQDPDAMEEKALSYLKGLEGFNESFANSESTNSMSNAKSAEDLEKMGFQTKSQVNKQISEKLGTGSDAEKMKEINAKVKQRLEEYKKLKQGTKKVKKDLSRFNMIKKPSFKINPLRGKPLKLRFEKSLNWQATKPTNNRPAMFEMNTQLGFKHTTRLTYNIVAGGAFGLGTDFNHIAFTYEGIRVGTNINMKLNWGISGQAGYERMFKKYDVTKVIPASDFTQQQIITTTKSYYDIAYCGLQKTYKLNAKYSGTMLIAYDFLWKHGNAKSPIIWRVGWKK